MKKILFVVPIILLLFSCQKNSVEPKDLEPDDAIVDVAVTAWETNEIVLTSMDIQELTMDSNSLEDDLKDVPSIPQLNKTMGKIFKRIDNIEYSANMLSKLSTDSLIWDPDTINGVIRKLYYDDETGFARYYEARHQFFTWQQLTYDSTEIIIDVNFTLDNAKDDKIMSIYNLKEYKESFFKQSVITSIEFTDYLENEITGIEATIETYYQNDFHLTQVCISVDLNPDGSGTLSEEKDFKDGTSSSASITFNPDNTGSYTRHLRNGNEISGNFNSIEDDMYGSLTETIDYPEGRYIDKINKSIEITVIPPDSISANYEELVIFRSGRIDSSNIHINAREIDDYIHATFNILKKNGAHGTLYYEQSDDISTLSGNWTTWNGYYILIDDTWYDNTKDVLHIHYEVYASKEAYDTDEDPILIAEFDIYPEQTGNGTISYNGITYNIEFYDTATATIVAEGKSTTINLYQ